VCYIAHPSHPFYLITLVISAEEYKLWSSLLCTFLQPPFTSFILCPDICLSSNIFTLLFPLGGWETKFHTHTEQQVKLYFNLRMFLLNILHHRVSK
jgi:hypothetical protein